nr:hypothetical protein [Paenibacillus mucilaginosus]
MTCVINRLEESKMKEIICANPDPIILGTYRYDETIRNP